MITIDQLLESVDLDFEPRWVTKDMNGTISIYVERPQCLSAVWASRQQLQSFGRIKLAEFENEDWTECIYEVPRRVETTGKIERFIPADFATVRDINEYVRSVLDSRALDKLNTLVDAVNELKGK